jgi:Sap, sulfolipid-1-addressing protein
VGRSATTRAVQLLNNPREFAQGVFRNAADAQRLPSLPVSKLALTIVAIALPDCLNPSLIGGELLVATRPHPRRATAAFTVGAWAITFLFGLALALGLGDLILALVPKPNATVKYGLITAAGFVMVLGAVIIVVRRNSLAASEPAHQRHGTHGSPALLGAGLAAAELLTAFPYFAAIALIVGSGVSNAGKLSLVVLYCVVYMFPPIAIAVVIGVMGDRAERVLRPAGEWLTTHWPLVVGPVTGVIGAGVLAFGITQLT